jgi:hypothetical protein
MRKQPYNNKQSKKATAAKENKALLKRLTSPKKILQQEATNNIKEDLQPEALADGESRRDTSHPVHLHQANSQPQHFEPITTQSMETTNSNSLSDGDIHPISNSVTTEISPVESEPVKKLDINLADSGFFEPVIEREYAEKPKIQIQEAPKVEVPTEAEKPKILFAPKLTLKTDDTYKKVMGDETLSDSKEHPLSDNAQLDTSTDSIPTMQFQEATFNLADDAPALDRQMGEQAGNTTSEWAFGMLENFYPEVVAFFTKIPTDWIEKAKLPNNLEADTLQKILAANARNKNKVKISDFHKKNILPPLKRILEKKGWENVMPDELLLVIGLVVLAADSFFKIVEIKKENKVLEKQIKQKIQEYIDIRTEERKEIDLLKGQLIDMQGFIKQFQAMQQQSQSTAA